MPKNDETAVLDFWLLQKFSSPQTMVGDLTQSYMKNGGSTSNPICPGVFFVWSCPGGGTQYKVPPV